jgi:hypothetical protein
MGYSRVKVAANHLRRREANHFQLAKKPRILHSFYDPRT